MSFFVGVTNNSWFHQLALLRPDEVNFWKPSGKHFQVLQPGELFLFKLHSPYNFIVGGGFFLRSSPFPVSLAWSAFGEKNGVASVEELHKRIQRLRRATTIEADPVIECIVLNQPFFWEPHEWIPVPANWSSSIVTGKRYDQSDSFGRALWNAVRERLQGIGTQFRWETHVPEHPRYGDDYLVRARLGQGGFKVLVTEEYQRRCSITGEKTLPVLQAAHIKPYVLDGPHSLANGLLLRADMHILFDKGLLTVTPDYKIQVSTQIAEQFTNGKLYYSYEGQNLRALPQVPAHRPSEEFLDWHNRNVFVS
jgi:putative restriction endonuclease